VSFVLCRLPVEEANKESLRELLESAVKREEVTGLLKRHNKDWHKPLFEGCPSTLLQCCFERLHTASMTKTKDDATNIDCRAQADLYQPKDSLYPKSLYRLKLVCLQWWRLHIIYISLPEAYITCSIGHLIDVQLIDVELIDVELS